MFGGVGIYVSEEKNNLRVVDEFTIQKSCHYPKCEIESWFVKFEYHDRPYIVGGIYRRPNVKTTHFVNDLETSLGKIGDAVTTVSYQLIYRVKIYMLYYCLERHFGLFCIKQKCPIAGFNG